MPLGFPEFDAFTLLTTLFWIWMLIDCIFNRRMRGSLARRICWFLFIFFTHFVGAIIYYFFECSNRNPFEAFTYYYQRMTQNSSSGTQSQMNQQPPPPNPYPDYQQGYQAQRPEPSPIVQKDEPQSSQAAPQYEQPQAQYEHPMISYPEIPQQQ